MEIKPLTPMNTLPDFALVRLTGSDIWLWYDTYTTRLITPQAGFSIEELEIENGFMPFSAVDTFHHLPIHLMLQSQMLPSLLFNDTEGRSVCFTAPDSILRITKDAPVLLGSLQDFPEMTMMARHPYPYPPVEHGTTAIILDKEQYQYYIKDLPSEAQERQRSMGQLIEESQAKPWQAETFNAFVDCPEELRTMVQQLAEDYYNYHQHNISNKPIPATADAFNADGIAKMLSAHPIQAYPVASTAPLSAWDEYVSDKENEIIFGFPFKKKNGRGISHVLMKEDITGQDREKALDRVKKGITDMGDYDSDLYMMMTLQLIVGSRNASGNVIMTMERVMNYHNTKAKKNRKDHGEIRTGGHRWEGKEKWSNSYFRMKNKWMKLEEVEISDDSKPNKKGRRARTTLSREAPLFMFGEEMYHNTLPFDGNPGKSEIVAWEYREASWMLPFIQGSNAYTGSIIQDCFIFDPFHEKWEKRLSKHFFFWLRTNAKNKEKPLIRIRDLFDEYDLEIDRRNPQRTRDRFERAMNVLAGKEKRTEGTREILAIPHLTWSYAKEFNLDRRHWLETWLSQQIIVNLPNEHNPYKRIEDAVQAGKERQQIAQASLAAKRKKGRPPGSKNKNK